MRRSGAEQRIRRSESRSSSLRLGRGPWLSVTLASPHLDNMPTWEQELMCSSVEECTKQAEIPEKFRNSAVSLMKMAPGLLEKAREALKNNQKEKAYILHMKYLNLVTTIKGSEGYKADKKYYDSMLGGRVFKEAIEAAEHLSKDLEPVYEARRAKNKASLKKKASPLREKESRAILHCEDDIDPPATLKPLITPIQVKSLMDQKSSTFLLLDVRKQQDYKLSHIEHPKSINISLSSIKDNYVPTASVLERNVSIQERALFQRRHTVDRIILFDWDSEEMAPDSELMKVKDALFKWDQKKYTCEHPQLLKGGYELFAMSYPTLVLNPDKAKKPDHLRRKDLFTNGFAKATLNIESIEYPDLDEGFLATPSPAGPKAKVTPDEDTSSMESSSSYHQPSANNHAILSGAITHTREVPKVPDRSSKPTTTTVVPPPPAESDSESELNKTQCSIAASSRNSTVPSAMNEGFAESLGSEAPKFDRSLKAQAVLKLNAEKNTHNSVEILQAEQDLAEESLELEQRQLKMEKDWESLRMRREQEAEDEMRAEMYKQEEELRKKLLEAEEEKTKKDEEMRQLRRQLEALKLAKDEEVAAARQDMANQIAEAIHRRDEERKRIQEEVKMKRELRIKKEKEAARQREKEIHTRPLTRGTPAIPSAEYDVLEDSFGGGLSRSYSSPNIAKMCESDEKGFAALPKPRVDRKSKPSSATNSNASSLTARPRNYQGVWGTGKTGRTGLKNLGNTCYMNSVLQCLSNFSMTASYFMTESYRRDLNEHSDSRGEVAIEYSHLISTLWSGQYRSVSPIDFKRVVGKYKSEFAGFGQQDAHEFLLYLLQWLHDDVNEVQQKVRLPEFDVDEMQVNDVEGAEKHWAWENKADRSFIREAFHGQRQNTLYCSVCKHRSRKFESFFELSVPLPPGNSKCNLRECIESWLKPEKVSWRCPKCQGDDHSYKQLSIVKFPRILVIHLNRFYQDGGRLWRKKQNMVDFELNNFDIGKYAGACNGQLNQYDRYHLFGVCNHFGTMEGGHYTAYCYSNVHREWYKYDDHDVSPMNEKSVRTAAAYMLFYTVNN